LLVDVLAAGLTGSSFSHQASSFGRNAGGPVDVGQLTIAIDPGDDTFMARIEMDLAAMTSQDGVRLPGAKRVAHRTIAERNGVVVPDDLTELLRDYAANGSPAQAT
jgi:(2R)-3-sulfolactate dehydrogenase (NADP+)